MRHTAASRHSRILADIRRRGEVRARDLCRDLGVTAMTVWRDLRRLEEQGLVRMVRGGATSGRLEGEEHFEDKESGGAAAKAAIARLAARRFIREGDTIGLEGGSTVAAILAHLPLRRVSIVTNSLPVALRVRATRPALPVKLLGGWLSEVSGNTCGKEALREAARLKLDTLFLSATGWEWARGPVDPNPLEIEVKRALAARAGRVVFLLDSGKFAIASASVVLHPRRIHTVVTNRGLNDEQRQLVLAQGVGAVLRTRGF